MSRYCLDTSAYSHYRRGDPPAVESVSTARWIGVPSIVLGELRHGFLMGKRPDENERELQEFLQHPFVDVLDVDDAAARAYAELLVPLRSRGTPIPTNDAWIAALAAREGAPVLTYDDRFRLVDRIDTRILETG